MSEKGKILVDHQQWQQSFEEHRLLREAVDESNARNLELGQELKGIRQDLQKIWQELRNLRPLTDQTDTRRRLQVQEPPLDRIPTALGKELQRKTQKAVAAKATREAPDPQTVSATIARLSLENLHNERLGTSLQHPETMGSSSGPPATAALTQTDRYASLQKRKYRDRSPSDSSSTEDEDDESAIVTTKRVKVWQVRFSPAQIGATLPVVQESVLDIRPSGVCEYKIQDSDDEDDVDSAALETKEANESNILPTQAVTNQATPLPSPLNGNHANASSPRYVDSDIEPDDEVIAQFAANRAEAYRLYPRLGETAKTGAGASVPK